MLGPFATTSRLTPIHQMSLAVLSRAACASTSTTTTTTTTTTRDRGDRYGMASWNGPNDDEGGACPVLDAEEDIIFVLVADGRQVGDGSRQVAALLAAQVSAKLHLALQRHVVHFTRIRQMATPNATQAVENALLYSLNSTTAVSSYSILVTSSPTRPTCYGHPREDVTRMIGGGYEKNCFRGI